MLEREFKNQVLGIRIRLLLSMVRGLVLLSLLAVQGPLLVKAGRLASSRTRASTTRLS